MLLTIVTISLQQNTDAVYFVQFCATASMWRTLYCTEETITKMSDRECYRPLEVGFLLLHIENAIADVLTVLQKTSAFTGGEKKTVHGQKTLFWTWTNTEVSKFNETILLSVLPVLPKSITSNVLYKPCSTWGGPCSAMEDEWVHCYHLTNQNVFEGSSIALSDLPLINAVPLWDCV